MGTGACDTVYLVHHCHTDIGYTHDPPVVWELYGRFLEEAIDLCARDADRDGDDVFRWTVETTAPLVRWLETAAPGRRRLLADLCRLGRIEVTAMSLNVTPLFDTDELIASLEPVRRVRQELGIPIRHAMNSDVNGQNWPLVDVLLDAGIEAFSMAINVDHGGAPPGRPGAFLWEGPSGRRLPVWNGWSYGLAWEMGIGHDARRWEQNWPAVLHHLEEIGTPLPVLMLQIFSGFGDNGPPAPGLAEFVRRWNADGRTPHLVLATPTDWWRAVAPYRDALPVWRGDWTDFWNFGAGSSALETAINRASRGRLATADAAGLAEVPAEDRARRRALPAVRRRAVEGMHLWDEHTWGADCSVGAPRAEDTVSQWYHKAACAHTARSLSLLLQRDAVAELARRVTRDPDDALLLFNPTQHPVVHAGPVPDTRPEAQRGRADDPAATRHFQDRSTAAERARSAAWGYLPPTEIPALGYTVVSRERVRRAAAAEAGYAAEVRVGAHALTFDLERGGIRSWRHAASGRELVDPSSWPLAGFVHERPASDEGRDTYWRWRGGRPDPKRGWRPGWPAERRGVERVVEHRVETTPVGVRVVQHLQAPGVSGLWLVTSVVDGLDSLSVEASWVMGDQVAPEACYLVFPFALDDARVRYDVGGQAVRPEDDQIPGACRDYFSVQRWVDIGDAHGGVTLACPDTPLWQFGGFGFGGDRASFELERPWLLAWVTNNYWHTNFRASQPGPVGARFVLHPYGGPFQEARCHRLGAQAAQPPVVQHLGEPPSAAPLPPRGSLLEIEGEAVRVLTLRRDDADGSVLLRLQNASDQSQRARVRGGVLSLSRAARCDLLGGVVGVLPLDRGGADVVLEPRGLAALRLWLRP